jgi:hypothetical protein
VSILGPILQSLAEQIGGAASEYVLSQGMLGTIIRAGINDGLSGRTILQQYRLAGGATADRTFWRLKGQIDSSATRFDNALGLLRGSRDSVQQIEGGKAGSYRIQMRGYYTREGEDGSIESGYQSFTIHQRELDVPSALDDAMSIWGDNSDTQSFPGSLDGLEVTGLYQYTG